MLLIQYLIILAALGQDHRAAVEEQKYPLDMALNSVDDQYIDCREDMAKRVETELLKKELGNKDIFSDTWHDGEKNAKKAEDNLLQIHSVAIYVYTNKDSKVYSDFNNAVCSDKQKFKDKTFKWYSLHFLVTDAIKILKKTKNVCYTTYRGTEREFDLKSDVRFGSFLSSSLDHTVAQGFGTKSCFEIKTCESADVIKYSKYPEQKEVLIPPYEMFKVTDVKTKKEDKELWCDTVYTLETIGKISYLNCGVDAEQFRVKL